MFRLTKLFLSFSFILLAFNFIPPSSAEREKEMQDLSLLEGQVVPSDFLNIYKNGHYTEPITIRHYNNFNIDYEIPENGTYQSKKYPGSEKNIGFKHNGTFYINPFKIENTGFHKIEVYRFSDNDGVIRPTQFVESFFIIMDLSGKLETEIFQDTFYYEHYNSLELLIDTIERNLSRDYRLSEMEIKAIEDARDRNQNATVYDSSLDRTVYLTEDRIEIKLKSIMAPDSEGEVLLSEKEHAALLIDVSPRNTAYHGKTISEYCQDNISFCINGIEIEVTKGTVIVNNSINFISEEVIMPLSTSEDFKSAGNLTISFRDNFGNIYEYETDVFFVHQSRFPSFKLKMEQSEIELNQFQNFSNDDILRNIVFFTEYDFGGKIIRDYGGNVESIDTSNINVNLAGEYQNEIVMKNRFGVEKLFEYTVRIKDENPPKILNRYNVILLGKNETFVFDNYFKVIDDTEVSFYNYHSFDETELEKRGRTTIIIEAEDIYGNYVSKEFLVFLDIEDEMSFYEKNIQGFLYNLRKIFYGG